MTSLHGKVAIITGASSGIGRATARLFAREGASVVLNARGVDALENVTEEIRRDGGQAAAIPGDVTLADTHVRLAETALERFGRLDVVVNSAGIGSVDAFLDTPDDNWMRVIGVNLTGTFLCCREGARLMQKCGAKGAIINVSSTAALSGEGPSHYCASKAGVMGLTRSIARELAASGIRVNTIVPGPTNTPMMAGIPDEWMQSMIKAIPLGRMCEPDEIARVAAFLASDDAGFITGQNIAVNGGMVFI